MSLPRSTQPISHVRDTSGRAGRRFAHRRPGGGEGHRGLPVIAGQGHLPTHRSLDRVTGGGSDSPPRPRSAWHHPNGRRRSWRRPGRSAPQFGWRDRHSTARIRSPTSRARRGSPASAHVESSSRSASMGRWGRARSASASAEVSDPSPSSGRVEPQFGDRATSPAMSARLAASLARVPLPGPGWRVSSVSDDFRALISCRLFRVAGIVERPLR